MRMISPAADSSAFPGEDVAAPLALVEILAVTQPRKETLERVLHPRTPNFSEFPASFMVYDSFRASEGV